MRDVIRVERRPDASAGTHEEAQQRSVTWDGPAVDGDSLAAVGRVTDEVLPSIVARLAVSGLGELEVRHGAWHIRVRRGSMDPADERTPLIAHAGDEHVSSMDQGGPNAPTSTARAGGMVTSPAVGYFAPRQDLAVGTRAQQGDVLGWVEVLGVRQEVVAPEDGLVGKWFAGTGDPVEYGEELVQLVPAGSKPDRAGQDAADA
jgi:biotin carboxyl carrier protein